jgi:DNA-binding winged helix-turn-helix (wHTH) protein
MQVRQHRTKSRPVANRWDPSGSVEMATTTQPLRRDDNRPSPAPVEATHEFGRFRVLLRRRQLLANGVPVELGTRAFDLLLALLGADGSLVSKEELMSQVWPGIVVSEENLKVQISALRKALGTDRDLIRTEFGRGYRFTGALYTNSTEDICRCPPRPRLRSGRTWFRFSCRHRSSIASIGLATEDGG